MSNLPPDFESYPDYYTGPRLIFDGALCCGVKHIYNLGWSPANTVGALPKVEYDEDFHDDYFDDDDSAVVDRPEYGNFTHSNHRCFTKSAPEESYGDRVKRYVDFLKEHRPKGLVVVTLVKDEQPAWPEFLEGLGFTEVVTFFNHNSCNEVTVYHLVM